jgi:hypothetical protein
MITVLVVKNMTVVIHHHFAMACSVAITSMQNHPRMQAYFPKIAALAAFDSTPGVISYTRQA